MSPSWFIRTHIAPGDHILSLCCGIGMELRKLGEGNPLTGVDITPEYITEFRKMFPWADTHVADALEWAKKQPDKSYDVVSIIDGVEHLTKKRGTELIKEAKRLCRKKAIVFTPEGYIKNEPKNTWGIPGGDHAQHHLSGWEVKDLEKLGFVCAWQNPALSQHNEAYNESMYLYERSE